MTGQSITYKPLPKFSTFGNWRDKRFAIYFIPIEDMSFPLFSFTIWPKFDEGPIEIGIGVWCWGIMVSRLGIRLWHGKN